MQQFIKRHKIAELVGFIDIVIVRSNSVVLGGSFINWYIQVFKREQRQRRHHSSAIILYILFIGTVNAEYLKMSHI